MAMQGSLAVNIYLEYVLKINFPAMHTVFSFSAFLFKLLLFKVITHAVIGNNPNMINADLG